MWVFFPIASHRLLEEYCYQCAIYLLSCYLLGCPVLPSYLSRMESWWRNSTSWGAFKYFIPSNTLQVLDVQITFAAFPCVKFLTEVINWLSFSFYDSCDLPLLGDWNVWHGELDRNRGACWNKDKGNLHWALPECIPKLSMLSSPSMSDIIKLFLGIFILLNYWTTKLLPGYDSCYWEK